LLCVGSTGTDQPLEGDGSAESHTNSTGFVLSQQKADGDDDLVSL
jgi:hypothetical protein